MSSLVRTVSDAKVHPTSVGINWRQGKMSRRHWIRIRRFKTVLQRFLWRCGNLTAAFYWNMSHSECRSSYAFLRSLSCAANCFHPRNLAWASQGGLTSSCLSSLGVFPKAIFSIMSILPSKQERRSLDGIGRVSSYTPLLRRVCLVMSFLLFGSRRRFSSHFSSRRHATSLSWVLELTAEILLESTSIKIARFMTGNEPGRVTTTCQVS